MHTRDMSSERKQQFYNANHENKIGHNTGDITFLLINVGNEFKIKSKFDVKMLLQPKSRKEMHQKYENTNNEDGQ